MDEAILAASLKTEELKTDVDIDFDELLASTNTTLDATLSEHNEDNAVDDSPKLPTIVLTNTTDIDSLNALSNMDVTCSPPILYENDFDLYTMVKEMLRNTQKEARPRRHLTILDNIAIPYGRVKKLKKQQDEEQQQEQSLVNSVIDVEINKKHLTAQLNDIHYTNGKDNWQLYNNYTPIYQKLVQCIGRSNILGDNNGGNKFETSDIISLDLQPLSTRIKLMCKLIIIIQGACIERYGPPKLVQDRCIQFDSLSNNNNNNCNSSKSTIKSNSCENLLLILADEKVQAEKEAAKKEEEKNDVDELLIKKKKFEAQSEVNSEDELENGINKKQQQQEQQKQRQYDLDNYYRHRMSKYSLKDYASVPYYQYSGRQCLKYDKAVNTDFSGETEAIIDNQEEQIAVVVNNNNKKDCSTSTHDLINDFFIGYYSKRQLLSEFSLQDVPSTLWNFYSNTEVFNEPVPPPPQPPLLCNTTKTEYYYSCSKEYYVDDYDKQRPPTAPPRYHHNNQQQNQSSSSTTFPIHHFKFNTTQSSSSSSKTSNTNTMHHLHSPSTKF